MRIAFSQLQSNSLTDLPEWRKLVVINYLFTYDKAPSAIESCVVFMH